MSEITKEDRIAELKAKIVELCDLGLELTTNDRDIECLKKALVVAKKLEPLLLQYGELTGESFFTSKANIIAPIIAISEGFIARNR